jgi:glycosyltransferase involved in cell wall biosynthesis
MTAHNRSPIPEKISPWVAIIGTVGVPGCYGGFETLVDNLVRYSEKENRGSESLTVYCSARAYSEKPPTYHGANLRYSRFNANGAQSVAYDIVTALNAVWHGHRTLLFLGVSGAVILPFLRLFTRVKLITNVDGIEWRRSKWRGLSRRFLRWSEAIATRYSHSVVADNQGIADYLKKSYGVNAEVIPYGGDHALHTTQSPATLGLDLPTEYALALCRIEPENNVTMILDAFKQAKRPLVFVGNWAGSEYGRQARAVYSECPNLFLLDAIYDPSALYHVRRGAWAYIHGHSAGGTNPSLVEMMYFAIPVFAFDCIFNRHTTEGSAYYFATAADLRRQMNISLTGSEAAAAGALIERIAHQRYRWKEIGKRYFNLFDLMS